MSQSQDNIDFEMAENFCLGEEKAFDFFFNKWYGLLCFYANKIVDHKPDAEEIVSGAFIKIWERHTQFHSAGHIKAYLYRIVRNDCLKVLQHRNKESKIIAETDYLNQDRVHYDDTTELITAELIARLYEALKLLPAQCSKVFEKLYVEGKTPKETAADLNISIGNVKTQKARGLASLRKKFIPLSSILFLFLF